MAAHIVIICLLVLFTSSRKRNSHCDRLGSQAQPMIFILRMTNTAVSSVRKESHNLHSHSVRLWWKLQICFTVSPDKFSTQKVKRMFVSIVELIQLQGGPILAKLVYSFH